MNVSFVQEILNQNGATPPLVVDGLIGQKTINAIQRYAVDHGIEGDLEHVAEVIEAHEHPAPATWDHGFISLPIERRFFKLPREGSILDFSYARGARPSGPRAGSMHHHQGIDLVAPVGTPLYSIADGGVVTHVWGGDGPARGFGGYGRIVVIHYPRLLFQLTTQPPEVDLELHEDGPGDELYLLHAHCDHVLVRVGDGVGKGQQVATVGRTAFSVAAPDHLCGAHDHHELALLPYPKGLDRMKADYGRLHPSRFYRDNCTL